MLDPRLATARYGDYLRRSLPPFWFTTDGALVRQSLQRLDELTAEATKPATKKKAKKPAAKTQPED